MNRWTRALLACGGALSAQAASAQNDMATRFGARDSIQSMSLSPDGKAVAVVGATPGRGSVLAVINLVGTPQIKSILSSTGAPDRLTGCSWATDARLVCNALLVTEKDTVLQSFTRLFALNADGSNLKQISARTTFLAVDIANSGGDIVDWTSGKPGSVLMERSYVPEMPVGTILATKREGLGVDRVDITSLSRSVVEEPKEVANGYISDGRGTIRVMSIQPATNTGYDGNRILYSYRKKGSRDWLPLSTVKIVGGDRSVGFEPVAVDPDLDVAYGWDSQNGRQALFKITLDGSLKRELVFERPDVDVDGLVRIGRQDRVVGVSYVTEKRESAIFDPELKKLAASLSKALPDRQIGFVDASSDENRLLLWAGGDTSPGDFYLFDKTTKQLQEILPIRPQLAHTTLAAVKPITFPAADGTMIPAYLTLPPGSDGKNIPAIVMPHGGPDSRDEWGFDWLTQYFANRGYAVLQPNYRGSSGYGDIWFANNGFRSWRLAIGDVNDAGRWLVKLGIANPSELGIFGWSYGGYAALQTSVLDPDLFKAIVAVAPVTDLQGLIDEHRNFADLPQVKAQIGQGPQLVEASPARNASHIIAPVLLFHGDNDLNVDIAQSRMMAAKLKDAQRSVQLVEFHGLDHQLDDSAVRAQLLDKADAFLRGAMHMKPAP